MRMDLAGIEVFVKVVQTGSISAAARTLGIPVTTASGQLAALEKRLGVTLVQRSTRKLHITQAGEAYFRHCALALAEIANAEQSVAAVKGEPGGLLRVTATPDIARELLPPLVSGYLERYPKVQIELVVTYRLVDFIAEGVDLGLRLGDFKDSSLMARRFLQLRLSLWATPEYLARYGAPHSPADCARHPLIHYQASRERLVLHKGNEQASIAAGPGRITVDDFDSLKAFLLLGQGIGVLPEHLAIGDESAGRLVRVLPEWTWARTPLRFVYPAQRFAAPKLQSFIAHCLEHLPAYP